jgi:hypothetical protein
VSAPEEFPYEESNPEPVPDAREKPMGFFDHLEEMRWTLIKCAATFLLFAGLIGYFLKEFNDVLLWPLTSVKVDYPTFALELSTVSIMEVFNVIIQMCLLKHHHYYCPSLSFLLPYLHWSSFFMSEIGTCPVHLGGSLSSYTLFMLEFSVSLKGITLDPLVKNL